VQTVDVLTPIVDDPYTFGRIAAVNALSDVYAMGGSPITAMNIVAFPVKKLGTDVLRAMLEGGLSAIREAGAVLVGGHSIKDEEPKYGLSVTGLIDPAAMMTNDALEPGQHLVLTKAVGTGVISSASKAGAASPGAVAAMVASMVRLNREAATMARDAGVRAATDVTGFGLAGHLLEMARASRCEVELWAGAVPLLPEALEHAAAGRFPGGSRANREHFAAWSVVEPDVDEALAGLMFDAQTSGGLLIAAQPPAAAELARRLRDAGHPAAVVGAAIARHDQGRLIVKKG
jgi:selenide,water dikinase